MYTNSDRNNKHQYNIILMFVYCCILYTTLNKILCYVMLCYVNMYIVVIYKIVYVNVRSYKFTFIMSSTFCIVKIGGN